ncbi:MAG: exonuclease SbcCD subunit D [Anaerovibrio sp.]|uniref:exonuclease SbcCD subunit D n=1 Tax=Anaerovibrio sp. TaxID=1872532 RepID=UPI0025FDC537|nr:exonuclease SbcCD subunit D [Anaerovibrio sp.]MCR5176254.1 exonuclease SbcCD subunit D [Anaerovibrio sp.]
MKLLHLGDLHLGKALGDFDLIHDQEYILKQILGIIDKEDVSVVLIAGDVYDKAVPSEAATRLLDYFLGELARRRINTVMISGNHDSDDRLNFGSTLFKSNRIFISAKYTGQLDKWVINDGGQELDIYSLPFVKASQVRHFYPDMNIETYEDAVRTILESAEIDDNKTNILVAHQFVAGKSEDPAMGGSEGLGTQSVGLVEKIGYDLFNQFDYVALGHIHAPQRVGRDEVRYAGSPLKYSLSEVNNNKSVPIITVGDNGDIDIRLVALEPMRNMRHIRGKMKELLREINGVDREDFIYATLTDEDIINDAMGIFQQFYPNTIKIDYDNSRTRAVEQVDISNLAQNKSFGELIGDFYQLVYNCKMSEDEMDLMREVAREAGIINETN